MYSPQVRLESVHFNPNQLIEFRCLAHVVGFFLKKTSEIMEVVGADLKLDQG